MKFFSQRIGQVYVKGRKCTVSFIGFPQHFFLIISPKNLSRDQLLSVSKNMLCCTKTLFAPLNPLGGKWVSSCLAERIPPLMDLFLTGVITFSNVFDRCSCIKRRDYYIIAYWHEN